MGHWDTRRQKVLREGVQWTALRALRRAREGSDQPAAVEEAMRCASPTRSGELAICCNQRSWRRRTIKMGSGAAESPKAGLESISGDLQILSCRGCLLAIRALPAR